MRLGPYPYLCTSVAMDVTPGTLQVKRRNAEAQPFHKRQHKAAEAGVHVQRHSVGLGERPQLGDGIDDAVDDGRHDQDGVLVDPPGDGVHVGPQMFRKGTRTMSTPKYLAAFSQATCTDSGTIISGRPLRRAKRDAARSLVGQHRQETALGASGGHDADRVAVAAQEVRRHAHHFVLKAPQAAKGHGVEGVGHGH